MAIIVCGSCHDGKVQVQVQLFVCGDIQFLNTRMAHARGMDEVRGGRCRGGELIWVFQLWKVGGLKD